MCQALAVSTSGYYNWRERLERPARRTVFDEFLTEQIREIHSQSRGTYGSPRVHAELVLGEGIHVGKKRVERLMRQAGLEGVYRRKKHFTTRRDPKAALSDDLVNRQFTVDRPDALWVGDVTEHPTTEGKVYLATVIDASSRRVVGWSIADHLRAELVVVSLAKRTVARLKMSRSSRSVLFLSRSDTSSACSSLVSSGRRPASISAWATQRHTADRVRPTSWATATNDLPLVRHSSITSALYSSVNDRRGRLPFSMFSVMNSLSRSVRPIVDIRQNG